MVCVTVGLPGHHLLCFPARRENFSSKHVQVAGIHTANRLGVSIVDTQREEELCVPSVLVGP